MGSKLKDMKTVCLFRNFKLTSSYPKCEGGEGSYSLPGSF